jgi:hypothetical protein
MPRWVLAPPSVGRLHGRQPRRVRRDAYLTGVAR